MMRQRRLFGRAQGNLICLVVWCESGSRHEIHTRIDRYQISLSEIAGRAGVGVTSRHAGPMRGKENRPRCLITHARKEEASPYAPPPLRFCLRHVKRFRPYREKTIHRLAAMIAARCTLSSYTESTSTRPSTHSRLFARSQQSSENTVLRINTSREHGAEGALLQIGIL